jgi:antitoxin (DNA-binding transcriptional repressor) of toxin-antitoxin stability system
MRKRRKPNDGEPAAARRKPKRPRTKEPLPGQLNVAEAKAHFSQLADAAARGETFIIAKAGRPIATIGPPPNPYRVGWGIGILNDQQVESLIAAVERPTTEQELAAWYDVDKFK